MKIESKDKLYDPFDLDNTKIDYIITDINDGGPFGKYATLTLLSGPHMIGKIQVPVDYISKLESCKICSAQFSFVK